MTYHVILGQKCDTKNRLITTADLALDKPFVEQWLEQFNLVTLICIVAKCIQQAHQIIISTAKLLVRYPKPRVLPRLELNVLVKRRKLVNSGGHHRLQPT